MPQPLKCRVQGGHGEGWECKLKPRPLAGGEPGARSPQNPLSEFLYRENGATASCLLQGTPTALTTGFWACPQQEKGVMSPCQARNCLSRICFHKRKEICITSKNNRASVGRETTQKRIPAAKGIGHLEGTRGWKSQGLVWLCAVSFSLSRLRLLNPWQWHDNDPGALNGGLCWSSLQVRQGH